MNTRKICLLFALALILAFTAACSSRTESVNFPSSPTVTNSSNAVDEDKLSGEPSLTPSSETTKTNEISTAQARSTENNPLTPDFIPAGMRGWFNECNIIPHGLTAEDPYNRQTAGYFMWEKYQDANGSGKDCLMICVDMLNPDGGMNENLFFTGYGLPEVSEVGGIGLSIRWVNQYDNNDGLQLLFEQDSAFMTVHRIQGNGVEDWESHDVEMPVKIIFAGDGRYFVPLYAILNEIGGGVIYDPLGDGVAYIYSDRRFASVSGEN